MTWRVSGWRDLLQPDGGWKRHFHEKVYNDEFVANAFARELLQQGWSEVKTVKLDDPPPKVVSLRGHTAPTEPNPTIVKVLEEALSEAKAGRIDAILLSWTRKADPLVHRFAHWTEGGFGEACQLLVALNYRMQAETKGDHE